MRRRDENNARRILRVRRYFGVPQTCLTMRHETRILVSADGPLFQETSGFSGQNGVFGYVFHTDCAGSIPVGVPSGSFGILNGGGQGLFGASGDRTEGASRRVLGAHSVVASGERRGGGDLSARSAHCNEAPTGRWLLSRRLPFCCEKVLVLRAHP